jgi:flagellar basal-body rod modification protein FlgD
MKVYNSTMSGNVISNDAGKNTVSKDGFLKLLAAQLQNQDPMNAGDNTQYVAQMAQFSALEQMQNLNSAMQYLIESQKFQEGSLMIGKTAGILQSDGKVLEGEVTGVKVTSSGVKIMVGGSEYSIDSVYELQAKPESGGSESNVV